MQIHTHTHTHTHTYDQKNQIVKAIVMRCMILSWGGQHDHSHTFNDWLTKSHSVVSDSLWPHGLYNPWNSTGQNTGVGSLSLLQGIFHPGIEPRSSMLQVDSLPAEPQGKPSRETAFNGEGKKYYLFRKKGWWIFGNKNICHIRYHHFYGWEKQF